jgi:predicted DNA-binding protein (UPF0278 family)
MKKGAITYKLTTMDMPINYTTVTKLIQECYEEQDMDKKVQILYNVNSLLPESYQINIPSLITNDYIDMALYRIEEKIHSIIALDKLA